VKNEHKSGLLFDRDLMIHQKARPGPNIIAKQ